MLTNLRFVYEADVMKLIMGQNVAPQYFCVIQGQSCSQTLMRRCDASACSVFIQYNGNFFAAKNCENMLESL